MLNKIQKNQGFTMMELIIYIAVISVVLTIALNFSYNVMSSNAKVEVSTELSYNSRIILEKITQKTHEAEDFNAVTSVFNSHPGVLALTMPGDDIVFDTYIKNITIGTESVDIRKLRMQVGSADPVDITSDRVDVTNFYLKNLSRSEKGKNVNLELTLTYPNPGNDPLRDEIFSFETGVSLRKQ